MSLERYLRREDTYVAKSIAAVCTLKGLEF